jgi:hypothetical protein
MTGFFVKILPHVLHVPAVSICLPKILLILLILSKKNPFLVPKLHLGTPLSGQLRCLPPLGQRRLPSSRYLSAATVIGRRYSKSLDVLTSNPYSRFQFFETGHSLMGMANPQESAPDKCRGE